LPDRNRSDGYEEDDREERDAGRAILGEEHTGKQQHDDADREQQFGIGWRQ
jgi:hypothetical protein